MNLFLDMASWILLLLGGFFCITAGVGLLRMPDFFTRAHAGSILDSMGAGLILLGLALQAPNYLVVLKLLFVFFFLIITSLAAIHALAQTVNVAGVNPKLANIVQRLDKNIDAPQPADNPTDTTNTDNSAPDKEEPSP
ncbi:hypothetical protein AB833_26920 [Chromatiales bacterium (ex Bugula neritina AB1)]|nr:hypothetical protein AB833_26920 [Chromatiales bacterium (ex Bugula neritina AB1)]